MCLSNGLDHNYLPNYNTLLYHISTLRVNFRYPAACVINISSWVTLHNGRASKSQLCATSDSHYNIDNKYTFKWCSTLVFEQEGYSTAFSLLFRIWNTMSSLQQKLLGLLISLTSPNVRNYSVPLTFYAAPRSLWSIVAICGRISTFNLLCPKSHYRAHHCGVVTYI